MLDDDEIFESLATIGVTKREFLGDPSDVYSGWTLCDYDIAMRGYVKRTEREDYMLMLSTAYILNCFVSKGKKITPESLLGKKEKRVVDNQKAADLISGKHDKNKSVDEVMGELSRIKNQGELKKQEELFKRFSPSSGKIVK